MANYIGFTRTNYFRVTDAERLEEIVNKIIWDEDGLGFFREEDGEFAFGAYGSICGLCAPEGESDYSDDVIEDDCDVVFEELRNIVSPDSAIIITEIGYEKLRYLVGTAVVITKNGIEYVDIWDEADMKVRDLLGADYKGRSKNHY